MHTIHIVPGSGGTFYCQNCLRDTALVPALRAQGQDVLLAPMYLPLFGDDFNPADNQQIFFGAVNAFLFEKLPWYRRLPRGLQRWLDSMGVLRQAARFTGTTSARGLEEMTLSVLHPETGCQSRHLAEMLAWMKLLPEPPDVVHLSNALLLGLAPALRRELHVPIVCWLQDELGWIDSMEPSAAARVWDGMRSLASEVDVFVSVSMYYACRMEERLGLPSDRLRIIYPGIDLTGYAPAPAEPDPPAIGFLSKLSPQYGLDLLVSAFLLLKEEDCFRPLRLRATGGMTRDVLSFLENCHQRLAAVGWETDLDLLPDFRREERLRFLQSLTLLSVPVPGGEAFGTYQIEAMACGVPVVQPAEGAFPEVVENTNGGVLFSPNTPEALAAALRELLHEPHNRRKLGQAGRTSVLDRFSIQRMAVDVAKLDEELAQQKDRT